MKDRGMTQGTMQASTDETIGEEELGVGLDTTADSFEKRWDEISTEELSTQSILTISVPESFEFMNESQEMVNPRPFTGGGSYECTRHGKLDQLEPRWPSTPDKTSIQAIPYPEMTPLTPLIKLLHLNSPVNAKKPKEAIEKKPRHTERKRKK